VGNFGGWDDEPGWGGADWKCEGRGTSPTTNGH